MPFSSEYATVADAFVTPTFRNGIREGLERDGDINRGSGRVCLEFRAVGRDRRWGPGIRRKEEFFALGPSSS